MGFEGSSLESTKILMTLREFIFIKISSLSFCFPIWVTSLHSEKLRLTSCNWWRFLKVSSRAKSPESVILQQFEKFNSIFCKEVSFLSSSPRYFKPRLLICQCPEKLRVRICKPARFSKPSKRLGILESLIWEKLLIMTQLFKRRDCQLWKIENQAFQRSELLQTVPNWEQSQICDQRTPWKSEGDVI